MYDKRSLFALTMVLLAISAAPSRGDPTEIVVEGARGTKAHILTMGGTIKLLREIPRTGASKNMSTPLKTAEVFVSFEQLRELNSNFTQVVEGGSSNRTHARMFGDLNFTCISDHNFTMPFSTNVTADCVLCTTTIKDFYAGFKLNACVIKQNGTITQQSEISKVTVGQLKFSVEITKGWPWCESNCKGGAGAYMDLDIGIKLPMGADKVHKPQAMTTEPNRPKRFDLGAGAIVEFSTVAALDGVWKSLTYPTPSLLPRDGLNVVTLRFPRFENNLIYDPTVDTGDKAWPPGSSAWKAAASSYLLLISYCLTAFLGIYMTSSG